MDPFFHTGLSISDSLKSVRKSVLIYETIIAEELLFVYSVSLKILFQKMANKLSNFVTHFLLIIHPYLQN